MSSPDDILRYRAALSQNREVFLLNYKIEFNAFDSLDKIFPHFLVGLNSVPALNQKNSLPIVPFIQIMQRSVRNSFESLSVYQSYQAWMTLRPFVEAALVIGKWLDDPQNATIWISRNEGKNARKQYQDTYSGDSMRSQSLRGSDLIRNVFTRVSDEFIQTNPHYYTRDLEVTSGNSRKSFDVMDDPSDHRAHLYAFLHLSWFVLHAVGHMFGEKYGDRPDFRVDLGKIEREFAPTVVAIARQNEIHRTVLSNLGLWPHNLLQPPKCIPS